MMRRCVSGLSFPGAPSPDLTESQAEVRSAIAKICSNFPEEYWAEKDKKKEFPKELHSALARDGWLGICMPQEYGGSELGLKEAAVMMQTIAESGAAMAGASSIHMNIFGLEPVVKFGTKEQKERNLPPLIRGEERACFAVTEPTAGLDTLKMTTRAKRQPDGNYILSGSKVWISTAQVAEKCLILARTTPLEEVTKPSQGLSLFYTPLNREAVTIQEIEKMGRGAVDSNTLFFEEWAVPETDRLGKEGDGFKMIMMGMNAERILIASEAIGVGLAALRRASQYAKERVVFGREIGKNQGIQHPLAQCWMKLESARALIQMAARLYDSGADPNVLGAYANSSKFLAADAAFEACDRAVLTLGGMGKILIFYIILNNYINTCHVFIYLSLICIIF